MKFIIKNNKSIILIFLGLLLIINKYMVLNEFGFKYTGSDDLIFWQSASDYMKGIFHEPYFYGQNYNFLLESIFAIPFLILGLPHYMALPISSVLISLFPFFLFSIILFRKDYVINSYLFLLIPLTLPIEYDILTSVSRGFFNGLFFCSFLVFSLLKPTERKSFAILGLSVSFAYITNPNSLLFSLPICLYLLFNNFKSPSFFLIAIVSSIPALIIQYFAKEFYINNPIYLVHSMWELNYSFYSFLEGFTHLDKYFRYLTPILWKGNWIVIILIIFLGFISLKNNWKKGLSILLSTLFIFSLMGINKINDDIGTIFLSSNRMFLAIPLFLGLSIFWTKEVFTNVEKWKLIILCLGISIFLIKISCYHPIISQHTKKTNFGPIAIKKIEDLKTQCSEIKNITAKYKIDLIVFIPNGNLNVPEMQFYNYGCPIIEENISSSVMNVYERRTWVFEEEKYKARKTVLIFNHYVENIEDIKKTLDCEIINNEPYMILIRNNNRNIKELSEILNFPYKRHTYLLVK